MTAKTVATLSLGEGWSEGPSNVTSQTIAQLAKSRSLEASQLLKQIKGELDWLVMKALDKDRSRRYATPTDFAQDVERYLSGFPIEAAPNADEKVKDYSNVLLESPRTYSIYVANADSPLRRYAKEDPLQRSIELDLAGLRSDWALRPRNRRIFHAEGQLQIDEKGMATLSNLDGSNSIRVSSERSPWRDMCRHPALAIAASIDVQGYVEIWDFSTHRRLLRKKSQGKSGSRVEFS